MTCSSANNHDRAGDRVARDGQASVDHATIDAAQYTITPGHRQSDGRPAALVSTASVPLLPPRLPSRVGRQMILV